MSFQGAASHYKCSPETFHCCKQGKSARANSGIEILELYIVAICSEWNFTLPLTSCTRCVQVSMNTCKDIALYIRRLTAELPFCFH